MDVSELARGLLHWFEALAGQHCVIALSGGVDSAVVAKAASLCPSIHVTLATGQSPALSRRELDDALDIVQLLSLRHEIIDVNEHTNADYARNDSRRCYFCKTSLFDALQVRFPGAVLITGTNADDLGDYRPGLQAAAEHTVRSPLAELGLGKSQVRQLAAYWGLQIADKPASPCLASRIAYGVEVTVDRLRRIEAAESFLRSKGFVEFRVRLHAGELARIEVPTVELARLANEPLLTQVVESMKRLGFRFVTLDLAGFQSGSLNQLIQITQPNSH